MTERHVLIPIEKDVYIVMKRNILLLACLLSTLLPAMAQVRLTGTLTDSLGTVINKESTVTLVTKNNMLKVAQGTVSQGRFTVEYAPQDTTDYLLYVFALGYKDRYIDVTRKTGNLGNIRLFPLSVALQEVVVRPGRLQHDIVNGNDVFRIAGTDLAQEHSITTMLRRLPGVMVDVNDKVTVVGAGTPIFTINGEMPRPGEMNVIKPDRIEEVVINTMPSAKYSADVNSVIDLKLKKPLSDYLNLQATNYFGANPKYVWDSYALHINMAGKKFSNYILLSNRYDNDKDLAEYEMQLTQLPDGTKYYQEYEWEDGSNLKWQRMLNISPKYQINDRSYVDVQYALSYNKFREAKEESSLRRTEINGTETERNQYWINSNALKHSYSHDLAARYVNDFTSTRKLSVNVGYSKNQNKNNGIIDEALRDVAESVMNNQLANSQTFTAKVDYQDVLGKKLGLETGAQYMYLTSDNRNLSAGQAEEDVLTKAKEQTAVAYLNVSQSLGKFRYSLGLRGEYQARTSDYHGLDRTDEEYTFSLIPKIGLNYRLSKAWSVNLFYDYQRINPPVSYLDPTPQYVNQYTYIAGNPDLEPIEIHQAGLRVTHLPSNITLAVNYRNSNKFQAMSVNDEENPQLIKQTSVNHRAPTIDISLSYYNTWGKYTLSCTGGYIQEFSEGTYLGEKIDYSRPPEIGASSMHYLKLPKGFALSGTFGCGTRNMKFPQETSYYIDGSLSVSWYSKNWQVILKGLGHNRMSGIQRAGLLYRCWRHDRTRVEMQLTVSYRMTKFKEWFQKNGVNSEARQRSILSY